MFLQELSPVLLSLVQLLPEFPSPELLLLWVLSAFKQKFLSAGDLEQNFSRYLRDETVVLELEDCCVPQLSKMAPWTWFISNAISATDCSVL